MNLFGQITKIIIEKRKAVYFLLIVMILIGSMMYQGITKSIFPSVKFPYVSIYTEMLGASSGDMETMITDKIENALKDLADVKEMRSASSLGTSLVVLKFSEKANVDQAVQKIQTKVNNIRNDLPKNAEVPIVEEYDITKFPVIAVEVKNDKPYGYLNQTVSELTHQIKGISGVTKVEKSGINPPEIQIIPNYAKMAIYKITSEDVIAGLKKYQMDIPLGSIEMNAMRYSLQTDNKIKSIEEIGQMPIWSDGVKTIFLKDISSVKYVDEIKAQKSYRVSGDERTPIVSLLVYIDKKADTIRVNSQIKTLVADYNQGLSPDNQVVVSMDLSKYIKKSIQDVLNNALSGLLAVVVVLYFFINMEEAVIASLVIPITLIASFTLFRAFGLTVNVLSIMGLIIALGMLVDNAIVVIEMIDENKRKHREMTFKEVVIFATNNVAPAIFSSTVTTICAFIPLAFLSGEEGALIRVIPITMAIAMTISFIVSITVTPMLCYQFVKRESPGITTAKKVIYTLGVTLAAMYALSNNWKLTAVSFIGGGLALICSYYKTRERKKVTERTSIYDISIEKIFKSKWRQVGVVALAVCLLATSLYLFDSGKVKTESMPKVDAQSIVGNVRLVKGSTLKDSMDTFNEIDAYLLENNAIHVYNASISEDHINYNIELKPKVQRALHSKMIIQELSQYVNSIPNVTGEFIVDGDEVGSSPIMIRIFSNKKELLVSEAQKVLQVMTSIQGVVDPKLNFEYSEPTLKFRIDKDKTSRMKVDVNGILMKLRYVVSGEKIIKVQNDDNKVNVVLKNKTNLESLSDIMGMTVLNSDGIAIPISELIEVKESRGINEIKHVDGKAYIAVMANFDSTSTVSEIIGTLKTTLEKDQILSDGVHYKVVGDYAKMNDSYSDLAQKFMIAILLVYFVLLLQFNGYFQPIVIIICVPFAIIGVVIGYYFIGLKFSTLSFLGVVSLVGIAVNDAIVLIDYINTLRKQGAERVESIIMGCKSRFKPILATSITTIAGVMPLALFNEDYSQMAYALVFGLMGSTLLTIYVVPSVLNIVEDITHRKVESAL